MMPHRKEVVALLALLVTAGCQTTDGPLDAPRDSDVELRELHDDLSRADLGDRAKLEWLRRRAVAIAQRDPRNPVALTTAGVVAHADGDLENAQVLLDRALSLDARTRGAAVARARIALTEGNVELARTLLERQLRVSPADAHAHEALAAVEFLTGDLDAAQRHLDAAREFGAESWRVDYHQGLLYEARDEWAAARNAYVRALELEPDEPTVAQRLRAAELRTGDR